jgi:hypothetical protein
MAILSVPNRFLELSRFGRAALFVFKSEKQGEKSRDLLFTLLFAGLVSARQPERAGQTLARHVA